MAESRVILKGSERTPVPGASVVGPSNPDERISITVAVRRKEELPEPALLGRILSREELVMAHGATANDFLAVREFAKAYGLQILAESAAKRTVELAGTVAAMSAAFGVTLRNVRVGSNVYRQRVGSITIPKELASIVVGVFGLDNRPQAQPRYRIVDRGGLEARAAETLSPVDIAKLYSFPSGDGAGQTVAIIELGGGFAQDDLNTYFQGLGLPTPSVTATSVQGGANSPGTDPNSDLEVMLDIEVVGSVAPGAHQIVYFAKNDGGQGFLAAVTAAIHDTNPVPTAISISWGNPESSWTAQSMQAFESAFQDAASLGIPVCVASGDNGSSDGTSSLSVDFPASAPHALGCGGTRLEGTGGTITSEVVWNDGGLASGGGVSSVFSKPSYQTGINVPTPPVSAGGRGVPDVAGHADGYLIRADGQNTGVVGTSAVAPLWAGLIARLAQDLGSSVQFLNPLIYQNTVSHTAFHDIVQGNNDASGQNGSYLAAAGWVPCTGLGSPIGTALLSALRNVHTPTPTPTPTPKPKPTPGTGSTGSTGSIGHVDQFYVPPYQPPYPPQIPPPTPAAEAPAPAPTPVVLPAMPTEGGSNTVAIVGVAAIVGLVATVGIVATVATVAISKDKA